MNFSLLESTACMRISLMLVLCFSQLCHAEPQQADAMDPTPLLPADTASPRDTLRSFQQDVDLVMRDTSAGRLTPQGHRALIRLFSTMDFSNTPHSRTWSDQFRLLVFLKEVIDRVALPPDEQIPGKKEVEEQELTRWSIPQTRLSLEKITKGTRSGQFLFSAQTIERIEALYLQAKHLPRKPGAVAGFKDFLKKAAMDEGSLVQLERRLQSRLRPVDTSTPRSTLLGFLDSINEAHSLISQAEAGLRSRPPTLSLQQALALQEQARTLLNRAKLAMDLSQIPEAIRSGISVGKMLQLKEVLDRMLLPPLDVMPDAEMVVHREGTIREGDKGQLRWTYPKTKIEIVQIMQGARRGEFVFSAETVERVDEFYQQVRHLPYRPEISPVYANEYQTTAITPGFYDFYSATPGFLVPSTHPLSRLVLKLPPWFQNYFAGQAVWKWISLAGLSLFTLLISVSVFRINWQVANHFEPPWRDWIVLVAPILVTGVVILFGELIEHDINITGQVWVVCTGLVNLLSIILIAFAAYKLSSAIAQSIIASPKIQTHSVDAALIVTVSRVLGLFFAGWYAAKGLREIGADVLPLLAGLGVGGLAVALAAQRTLANFFGGLLLYVTKPVNLGDRCRFGDQIGTIEAIGLQNTSIRTSDRSILTIPNAEFSQAQIANFSRRDHYQFKTVLHLANDTSTEQLRFLLVSLRELLIGHPRVLDDPRVRLIGLSEHAINIEVDAAIKSNDNPTFLAIQEDLLLRFSELIEAAGTRLAVPVQRLRRDEGIDKNKQQEAEEQIRRLRATGKLPFPDFEDEQRDRLFNRLDYPPKGSSGQREA